MATFRAVARMCRPAPLRDCLFLLRNKNTDPRDVIKINRISIQPTTLGKHAGFAATEGGSFVGLEVVRVSAYSGGALVAGNAHSNLAFVDDCYAYAFPDSVTEVASIISRCPLSSDSYFSAAGLGYPNMRGTKNRDFESNGVNEGIDVSAGNSIALVCRNPSGPMFYRVRVIVKDGTSAACMSYVFEGVGLSDGAAIAVIVSDGTAVIKSIEILNMGDVPPGFIAQRFRLCLVDAIAQTWDASAAEYASQVVDIIGHSPLDVAPAGIECIQGPLSAELFGERYGYQRTWDMTHVNVACDQNTGLIRDFVYSPWDSFPAAGSSAMAPVNSNYAGGIMRIGGISNEPYEIPPNASLAICVGSQGVIFNDCQIGFNVEVEFSTVTLPSAGAVFRTVGSPVVKRAVH